MSVCVSVSRPPFFLMECHFVYSDCHGLELVDGHGLEFDDGSCAVKDCKQCVFGHSLMCDVPCHFGLLPSEFCQNFRFVLLFPGISHIGAMIT